MSDDAKILDLVAALGPDERRVLLVLARRLKAGQAAYGALRISGDPRSWTSEAVAEFLDATLYLTFEAMRRESP